MPFAADKITIFNMTVSFSTGQPSGDWIKDTLDEVYAEVYECVAFIFRR